MSRLRGAVLLIVLFGLIAPIAVGLAETTRAAFGVLPALGQAEWSLAPWRMQCRSTRDSHRDKGDLLG